MKILINGQEEPTPPDCAYLGEVLDRIQKSQTASGQFIMNVRVDGKAVEFDSRECRNREVASLQQLEIALAPLSGMIERNLDNAEDYLARLIPGIGKAAELFRAGSEQEANKFFLNIIDGIDWFSQVTDAVIHAKKLDIHNTAFNGKSLQDRKVNLVDRTQKILDAHQSQDWVLLADLLANELQPFYREWAEILPQFKAAQPPRLH